ncbi:MAG: S8 family serine peptidase [Kiritimatiellae bacterium]|nr:S8 family serine peptidase [Kiritimatiellia bacterium]MDW8458574.1 S8 family serine peptidase [Verrucomicrobiota bacterium]
MRTTRMIGVLIAVAALAFLWASRTVGGGNAEGTSTFELNREGDRYTLKAKNAKLADILSELRNLAGLKLDADPALDARVTADLSNATLEEVLAALAKSRALVYERTRDDDLRLIHARLTSEQPVDPSDSSEGVEADPAPAPREVPVPRGILTNSRRSLTELRRDDAQALLFSGAILDTRAVVEEGRLLEIPDRFRASADSSVRIVQFNRPVSSADVEAIEALGGKIHHYVPHRAYAVKATPEQWAEIQNLPGIYVIEPYHPYFKMSEAVREKLLASPESLADDEPAPFSVLSFAGADVRPALQAAGVEVLREATDGQRSLVTVRAKAGQVMGLLHSEAVQWVEPFVPAKAMNDLGRERLRVPSLRNMFPGLTGEGVIIAVTDTGIDFKHQTFSAVQGLPTSTNINTRIVYYDHRPGPNTEGLPGDVDGHGTHVAATLAGNGALSQTANSVPGSAGPPFGTNQFAGVAPRARLVVLEDYNSISDNEQARIAHQQGARISNNSWGVPSLTDYSALSAIWDALVRDADPTTPGNQELITFFAAGNDGGGNSNGTGGDAGTILSPGNAKNVITMGALELPRRPNNIMGVNLEDGIYFSEQEADSDWQVASYSSRGPVSSSDLRVKPDLVAPGSYIISAQSHETSPDEYTADFSRTDYRFGNVDTGTNYAFMSGTSMSTPLGAGAAALIYQHLTNTLGAAPSPALMKAILVAGARTVNSLLYNFPASDDDLEIVHDGWGLIDVARSVLGPRIRPGDGVILFDQSQTTPLQTDQLWSYQLTLGANDGGLKVVLAYTDRPGTPGAGIQLVNNLDLIVFAPNGSIYRGNQFAADGVHSRRFTSSSSVEYDQFNNVEVVTIPGGAGTYTIRVYGRQVPQGPQDFALVIQRGIGLQGRTAGSFPAIALDSNGLPVIAYSLDPIGGSTNVARQIHVRRWVGPFGDTAELNQWKRLEDQWYAIRDSLDVGGISKTLENSDYPSIAIHGDRIYVAWEEGTQGSGGAITNQRIFLRMFNGTDWVQVGNSAVGYGVSKNTNGYDATRPAVAVMPDGSPVVAWLQDGAAPNLRRVFVARWDGTNWVGFGGSHTNGVPSPAATRLAEELSLTINGAGNPVVAFKEVTNPDGVVVMQWTGSAWGNISPPDSPPFIEKPRIAAGPGPNNLALAWIQTYGAFPGIYESFQVYAARYTGTWVAVAGSQTFPGVSAATNLAERPVDLTIGVSFNNTITIMWQGGTNAGSRTILGRRWMFGATNWSDIAGSARMPGITKTFETYSAPRMAIDSFGLPIVTFVNTPSFTNIQEVQTYTLIGDRAPPTFAGLQTAVGGTNNNVVLNWLPASDDTSTTIIYRIFRGTQTFACGVTPTCDIGNVFSNQIATVTNVTTFTVTGLTANLVYCFGVRAVDQGGLMDSNTVVRSAGPVSGTGDNDLDCLPNGLELAIGTEPCVRDTDGDGMWDGWEWTYSTNNTAKTNSISISNTNVVFLNPVDNGVDNVRTAASGDGTPHNLPGADPDGDGASNLDEFLWWLNSGASCAITNIAVPAGPNPTAFDTDNDGMPDGWEIVNNLNPIVNDAALDVDGDGVNNLNEYLNGGDPRTPDTDGDGVGDATELVNGTILNLADSDADGLDDGFEAQIGSNPRRADSNNSFLPDGLVFELGQNPTGTAVNFKMLLHETFESTSPTLNAWTSYAPNVALPFNFWHLSFVEPQTNLVGVTNPIVYFDSHTRTGAYRAARDTTRTNLNANYSGFGSLAMALQAPTLTNSASVSNLFVSWLEWYETEPNADFCVLQARSVNSPNWINVSSTASGRSGVTNVNAEGQSVWVRRTADLSAFAGHTNVQIRFLFTANAINNQYKGWFVDDVRVYEAVTIAGWVRDINGRAVEGAVVRALGRGGVTNILGGHVFVRPGHIFGEAYTEADGSYRITGLPAGQYYVKAEAASHIAEFYDGPLFTGAYAFAAGFRPGVPNREQVTTNGIVNLPVPGQTARVHFELERGSGHGRLGVAAASAPVVTVNESLAQRWNGSVSTPAFTNMLASSNLAALAFHLPDWLTNAVAPRFLFDLAPGDHRIYIGTNVARFPIPSVRIREGETIRVEFRTNAANARLSISAADGGSYLIRLNGRLLTNLTPSSIPVFAGRHDVSLVSTMSSLRVGTKSVTVAPATMAHVMFATNETQGSPGFVWVRAVDINGNAVSGLQIRVNGVLVGSNDVSAGQVPATPALLTSLRPGTHLISISGNGYKHSEVRSVTVLSGITNVQTFIAYEADRDFDRVGDALEISAYTNLFLYHRANDPDGDGLNNLGEYDLFRLFNVRSNPFLADTDGDGMADGAELAYNGVAGSLALSALATNAIQHASTVPVLFVGRYLDGINYFGTGTVAASINGDRFVGAVFHPVLPVPTPDPAIMLFTNVASFPSNIAVNAGHNAATIVFADGRPDVVDTDADGMWDGFEAAYGLSTIAKLDVIEHARGVEDPDADGLTNIREFLGVNNLADALDSSNPTLADTDGDFIPDGWEYTYGFNPLDPTDAFEDPDGDGLVNLGEYLSGANPTLRDTDADGLPDFEEVVVYLSDPLDNDTDGDGLLDGQEVWDKNLDGIQDGGFFPMWAGGDLDGDGLMDGPTDWDTDGDGMPDGFEVLDRYGNLRNPSLNPYDPTDGDEDADGDGLTNLQEYLIRDALYGNNPIVFGLPNVIWDYSTDPFDADSDNDGMPDGFESLYGLHPVDPIPVLGGSNTLTRYTELWTSGDPDFDGLWNLREYRIRFYLHPNASTSAATSLSTHPWNPDTDGDGLGDGEEDRAFRSHPIRQDADQDRLTDGVSLPEKWGEIESVMRESQYALVITTITWNAAFNAAQISHAAFFGSPFSNIIGQLAVFSDPQELIDVFPSLGITSSNIAIGGVNEGVSPGNWTWINGEPFYFFNSSFTHGSAASSFVAGVVNHLTLTPTGLYHAVTNGTILAGYVIEWEDVPVVTNHYDFAHNDLWQLIWPAFPDNNLPYWQRVDISTNSPVPQGRWGAAMTYIPVFETKLPKDDNNGTILLDNRQLVVIGGRDGVNRFKDVWEFIIRSNMWVRSAAPLYGAPPGFFLGLSESAAVPVFGYRNTKAGGCPCDNQPYDCIGDDFGEPKNRPWQESRSFDWTFLFGGWSEAYTYSLGHIFYKSTDDPRPITDVATASKGATEFINENTNLTAAAQQSGSVETFLIGDSPTLLNLDGGGGLNDNPTGYSAFQFADFALTKACEKILSAELLIGFQGPPTAPINASLYTEFTLATGASDENYASDLNTTEPSVRIGSPAYFNSPPLPIVIPAGQNVVTVDVSSIVIAALQHGNWGASRLGFVINAVGATNFGVVRRDRTRLRVSYVPSYKSRPFWQSASAQSTFTSQQLTGRKSAGLVYDYDHDVLVVFGGIDGNDVLGDTHVGQIVFNNAFSPIRVEWTQRVFDVAPSPRWGHSMVYDAKNKRVVLFGGFDSNHRPLNDLWFYSVQSNMWTPFTTYRDDQIPQPRGGASMIYFGDYDYNRGINNYCVSGNKQKIVMFGGTDGKTYFNDTWVFDDVQGRWILVSPVGEQSISPPPRAFASMVYAQNARLVPDPNGNSTFQVNNNPPCASPVAFLFGGRSGLLPTGRDTDFDMVEDGTEHELGGPTAGRDPRVNALIVSGTSETIPYAFKRIGSVPANGNPLFRGVIANFESLRHDKPDVEHAADFDLPYEGHRDQWTLQEYSPYIPAGVDAISPEYVTLWYHRHGVGDPFDPRDRWQLGRPDNSVIGSNGAPPYAYSGRWVYGTDLKSGYPNNALMELYSPLLSFKLPSNDSTDVSTNSFFLVFHEWLDLADSNDVVRIDAVRPETPADILNRVTGVNRPVKPVLPNRNNLHNTTGEWRRVIVPLDILANDTNVFLRFTLQSDGYNARGAGGWYIDDVAIIQAYDISGVVSGLSAGTTICLIGQNFNQHNQQCTQIQPNGGFNFGLLPLGNYQIVTPAGTNGPIVLAGPGVSTNFTVSSSFSEPLFTSIGFSSPLVIRWTATNGAAYKLDATTNLLTGPWVHLYSVTSGVNTTLSYTDNVPMQWRFYRVSITNSP